PQPAADVRPTPTRSRPRHRAVRAQHVKAAERVTRPHPVADSATALSAGSSTDWFLWFVVALLGAALSTLLVGALSYLQTDRVPAEKETRADLRVREPLGGKSYDLQLLSGQLCVLGASA